jgi:hypothetical protein
MVVLLVFLCRAKNVIAESVVQVQHGLLRGQSGTKSISSLSKASRASQAMAGEGFTPQDWSQTPYLLRAAIRK